MRLKREIFSGFVKLEAWDAGLSHEVLVVRATDSVAGLLYDRTNKRVLLVRQQRAAMVRGDNPDGYVTEGVAGRFDHKTSPKALLVKEALEEAGVTITENDVELLNDGAPVALSAGVLTERVYLAFAEIHPSKVAEGEEFGLMDEGERIARVWQGVHDFIRGPHEDLRVWAFARLMESRIE